MNLNLNWIWIFHIFFIYIQFILDFWRFKKQFSTSGIKIRNLVKVRLVRNLVFTFAVLLISSQHKSLRTSAFKRAFEISTLMGATAIIPSWTFVYVDARSAIGSKFESWPTTASDPRRRFFARLQTSAVVYRTLALKIRRNFSFFAK